MISGLRCGFKILLTAGRHISQVASRQVLSMVERVAGTGVMLLFVARVISSTLKMEATRSSETSAYNEPTWRHIPEDGILQDPCCYY
jgi:hypothetical protein